MKEKPQEVDGGDMSRRAFWSRLAGTAAAGVGAIKLGNLAKTEKGPEFEKVGEAEITRKIEPGYGMAATFDPINPGVSLGNDIKLRPARQSFKVVLKINGREQELKVAREDYDSYQVGQKVRVKYRQYTGTEEILSIER